MRSISLVVLFILAIVTSVASDQSCNSGDAKTVDTDPSLIGIAVSAALLLEVEAALVAFVKRDFTCASGFQCYSIKGSLLCYDKSTHNFITAAGTTGNTATGDYQLADGRKGNLYRGPWPRPTTGQGAATSVLVESIAVSNTAATTVEENIAVQTSGAGFSAGAAGATSTGANSGGPVATSAGASPPLATHNGALRIQQPANAVWGIGALIAWAILP